MTSNGPITTIIDEIGDVVTRMASTAIIDALVIRYPFLGVFCVKPIVDFIVTGVVKSLIKETEWGAFIIATKGSTDDEVDKFTIAAQQNSMAQKTDNAELKKQAQAALEDAARKLIKLGTP